MRKQSTPFTYLTHIIAFIAIFITAFAGLCSWFIQSRVFTQFADTPEGKFIALLSVTVLEATKVCAPIALVAIAVKPSVRLIFKPLVVLLMGISLMSSFTYFTQQLNRPNDAALQAIQQQYRAERQRIKQRYAPELTGLRKLLELEKGRRRPDGTWIGSRAKELMAQIDEVENKQEAKIKAAEEQYYQALHEIRTAPIGSSSRTNPYFEPVVRSFNARFGASISYGDMAMLCGLGVSLALELAILLFGSIAGTAMRDTPPKAKATKQPSTKTKKTKPSKEADHSQTTVANRSPPSDRVEQAYRESKREIDTHIDTAKEKMQREAELPPDYPAKS